MMASDCPGETFFDYWVLKESYMKATGLGFKLPLNAFRIAMENDIKVYANEIQMPYGFYQTTVCENFKLAVCTKGDPPNMKMRFLYAADPISTSL